MSVLRRNKITRERRQIQAKERQVFWKSLSFETQIKSLDEKLGDEVGATKQRQKIKTAIILTPVKDKK